jgi:hypothetical protein
MYEALVVMYLCLVIWREVKSFTRGTAGNWRYTHWQDLGTQRTRWGNCRRRTRMSPPQG